MPFSIALQHTRPGAQRFACSVRAASLGDPLVSPSPARELDVCRCARLSVWFLGMQTRGLGLVQQELGGRGISEALP